MNASRSGLRRRFLVSFASLLGGLAMLSFALTAGSLYLHYRSTVSERTLELGQRFDKVLREAEHALLFRTRILADVAKIEILGQDARPVRELQVYTLHWLKRDNLQVVGSGNRAFWIDKGFEEELLRRAFAGIPSLELDTGSGPAPRLLGAIPTEGPEGVAEAILTAYPLDSQTIETLARKVGGEITLCDRDGRVLTSSLGQLDPGEARVASSAQSGDLGSVSVRGLRYAYRTFPLRVDQRVYGTYSVLWPVGDLQRLTARVALLQLGGAVLGFAVFFLLYRRIIGSTTDQVEALTRWAREYSPQNPTLPPRIAGTDEVGLLSQVFQRLMRDLQGALDQVEIKNQELARANLRLEGSVREKTRQLEDQRRILDTVLTGMTQAVFLVEGDGRIAYANQAARLGFGKVAGQNLALLLGDVAAELAHGGHAEVRRDGRTYVVNAAPLEGTQGAIFVAQDETQRRALERQLQQSQKMESVGRLAGGVAHDFNNVLASILPCIEMLRRRLTDGRAGTYLDTIENAANRATEVVRQLLAFSRAGEFRPLPLDLNGAVEGALKILRPGLKDVRLTWDPGADLPQIHADETQVQQVVFNLTLNAVDAMGGQGEIFLRSRFSKDEDAVELSVEDRGPGVPREILDKIFDPFFTTKEPGKGTGLGLSIVYGVVERQGGSVRVENLEERGARFVVKFPLGPTDQRDGGSSEGHVLVVDDDALLRGSLSEALREYGFEVTEADGATQTLEILAGDCIGVDAILLDVRMPGMDGTELAGKLRKRCPDLPLLFMTGYADGHVNRLTRISGSPPLLKPFAPSKLVRVLRSIIRQPPGAGGAGIRQSPDTP